NSVVTNLHPILNDAEHTLKAATDTSQAVDATLKTYTSMMKDLFPPKPPEVLAREATNQGRPFDILDYAQTAEQVGATTLKLQQLIIEIRKTLETNAVSERLQQVQASAQSTINEAQTSTRELTNHIAMLAVGIIVIFFICLFAYRLLAARFRKPV